MQVTEMRLSAMFSCTVCGERYVRPILTRTGEEAKEHLCRHVEGVVGELNQVVTDLMRRGKITPSTVASITVTKVTSITVSNSACSKNHPNIPVGVVATFTCDNCGRDHHLPYSPLSKPERVSCPDCRAVYRPDWSLCIL